MLNIINYFYNLNPKNINKYENNYYFYHNQILYNFIQYTRAPEEQVFLKELTQSNKNFYKIVINKNNEIITPVNNIPYILLKIQTNPNLPITLNYIEHLTHTNINTQNKIIRKNWYELWTNKIDYFEYQIHQTGKKYPLLVDSFNYFIGLTENAISYLKTTINNFKPEPSDSPKLSHNKITLNDTIYTLNNPLNLILDHPSRDIAEYIKLSFFKNNYNILDELNTYFSQNYYSHYGIRLLISRIIYPSFYFDIYENILTQKQTEKDLLPIINRINDYEYYLKEILTYLTKFYNTEEIIWITKKR